MEMQKPQIYGWTDNYREGEEYVRYFMAFEDENGVRFAIRNGDCVENDIIIPDKNVRELINALLQSVSQGQAPPV